MKPMTAVGTKTEMNCFFRIASSENPYGRAIPKLTWDASLLLNWTNPSGLIRSQRLRIALEDFFVLRTLRTAGGNIPPIEF